MDWAYAVSTAIVALSAPLATIAVQWLSNRHNAKMRKLELFEANKQKRIEQYVHAVNDCITAGKSTPEFEKLSYAIELYVPSDCIWVVEDIRLNIETENFYFVKQNIAELCQLLRKEHS